MRRAAVLATGLVCLFSGELAGCSGQADEPLKTNIEVVELPITQGEVSKVDYTFDPDPDQPQEERSESVNTKSCMRYLDVGSQVLMSCYGLTIDSSDISTVSVTIRGCKKDNTGSLRPADTGYIQKHQGAPSDFPFYSGEDYYMSGKVLVHVLCDQTFEIGEEFDGVFELGQIRPASVLRVYEDARLGE